MPTTVPPRDGDSVTGASAKPVITDEKSLQRVFDAELAFVITEAQSHLPDSPGLVPRVVEGAFVRAWDARSRLHSVEQVQAFLKDDVKHGAARALSRKAAAHRFGAAGGEGEQAAGHAPPGAARIDPGESWGRIIQAVRGGGHSSSALAMAAEARRHGAAEHMAGLGKTRSWKMPVIIGVAGAIGILGLMRYLDTVSEDPAIAAAVVSANVEHISSSPGQMGSMTLGDGSEVRIAPESRLSLPKDFPTKFRAVRMEGAALFHVAQDQPKELQIHLRDAVLVAKGTTIIVHSYEGSPTFVGVREGRVELRARGTTRTMILGQAVVIPDTGAPRVATMDETSEASSWADGYLTLVNRPLRDVLPQFKRWYRMDIVVPDRALLDRVVNLRAPLDSVMVAINHIEQSGRVRFGWEGEVRVFRDAPPQRPRR